MSINVEKLHAELVSAGLPITGCNSDGAVSFETSATQAQRDQAAAIVAAHDPTPTLAQKMRARGLDPRTAALILVVKRVAQAPQWAQDLVTQAAQDLAGA